MLFRKKKKDEPHKGDIFLAKGIYLKQPVMQNGHVIANCFLRGIIVFLLVFGSVGGFLSAFSISYNYVLVIVSYLILVMFFSFLYSTSKLLYRDIGYIGFFAIFIAMIIKLSLYANSGYYAILNRILEHAQSFFELSGVRQYDTKISDDYLTIAIVAIFIGMVLIIILNIWLSSTMSMGWTIFLTFPMLFIPIYMELMPDLIYLIALGSGYLAVLVFKANGHYLAYAKDASFHIKGFRKDKVTYTQDGSVFRQVLVHVAMLMFLLVIIVEAVFTNANFQSQFKRDWLREETSEYVGNFVLLGFSGLYDRYDATGGLAGGKLGGISSVMPDYLPDLEVVFAPYSNEAVYLKAYTGGVYGENEWESIYVNPVQSDREIFEAESMKAEALSLRQEFQENAGNAGYGKMFITNVGADAEYMYYPYYTLFEDYSQFSNYGLMSSVQGIKLFNGKSFSYYPKVVWEENLGEVLPNDIDTTLVESIYLEVPEKNKAVIEQECQAIGLNPNMTENEIVTAVREYFDANIPYTLKPGATPKKQDFINYFLTKNRKGYCAHFASAATLIFRQMGIPARYVEGYAFDMEAVLASDEYRNGKYSEYYQGYSSIGESTVMKIEVTDAMAHAWVEIYVEDFGWKVVEVTPGSNLAVDEDNFWDAFSSLLGSGDSEIDTGITFGELNIAQYSWLVYVACGMILGVVVIDMIRIGIRKGKRYYRCHVGNQPDTTIAYYADLCDMIRVCDKEFNACRSHAEQLQYMKLHYSLDIKVEEYSHKLEKISFSAKIMQEEELIAIVNLLKQIRKEIWKCADLKQRIRLCRR